MAKKRITASVYAQAHKAFAATLTPQMAGGATGKAWGKFRGNGPIARWVSARQYDKYLAAGGTAGDWKEFAKWLLENLPAIIAAIMAIFA